MIRGFTGSSGPAGAAMVWRGPVVSDLLFVLLTVALFTVLALAVKGAERL